MSRQKRNKNLIFKVNEDEWKIIQKRVEQCNVSSMSELFRHMMINGIYLEYSHEELKKIRQSVMSVANNVNQIALRVNSTSRIYKQEITELREGMNKLWQQLECIQSELRRLNPSNI
ncbi:MAG: plasmid mobilization relaxosome protein MobC [Ruminococcus sp.]|nr:plasmid mobilization relaxosome protein MobC [Ruminococcus sp.]